MLASSAEMVKSKCGRSAGITRGSPRPLVTAAISASGCWRRTAATASAAPSKSSLPAAACRSASHRSKNPSAASRWPLALPSRSLSQLSIARMRASLYDGLSVPERAVRSRACKSFGSPPTAVARAMLAELTTGPVGHSVSSRSRVMSLNEASAAVAGAASARTTARHMAVARPVPGCFGATPRFWRLP